MNRMKLAAAVMATAAAVMATAAPKGKSVPGPEFPAGLAARPTHKPVQKKMIEPGVTYYGCHFKNLGDGPVATHWLVIEWEKVAKGVSLNISRNPERRERPTTLAENVKPIACVNGTYHSTVDPSVPFYQLKVRGELIPSQSTGGDCAMAFNQGEMPVIGPCTKAWIDSYENIISGDGISGFRVPCFDDYYKDQSAEAKAKRENGRAPRTFAGNNVSNKWTVIGIADGRQPGHSIGVNFQEICYMLIDQWGCDNRQIVSFDGGGSTMMAIKKGGSVELVNRPSDGAPKRPTERRVAESIQIINAKSHPDAQVKGAKKAKKDKSDAKKKDDKKK